MSFLRRVLNRDRVIETRVVAPEPRDIAIYGTATDWPNFALALEAYRNPIVALAIDSIVGGIMSTSFYFTSSDPQAAERVTRWSDRVGLRGLLFDVVRELVLTGNSFLRPVGRGEQLRLIRIPLSFFQPRLDVTIENEEVKVVNYYITVRVGTHYETRKIPASEIIHLAWNVLDPAAPWGHGIAYQLVTRQRDWRGNEVPSPLEAEAALRRNLILFLNRAIPKRFVRVNVPDQELTQRLIPELAAVLEDPSTDYITNLKKDDFDVIELKSPELKFEYYSIFENLFIAALRSPIVKLFTTPGFTEASAREATSLFDVYMNSLREYVEHVLENKIFPLVIQSDAKVEVHWGQPERPELKFGDILAAAKSDAFNAAIITREEARRMLRELGWILEQEPGEAGEAFGFGFSRARVVDTISAVHIYMVDADDIDRSTIRYQSVDSEKGITLVVAFVKSTRQRQPVALIFDKTLYDWNIDKAKQYYNDVFPRVLEKLRDKLI